MSFLDHIEELRWHIIRSAIVLLVVAIVTFIFKSFVFNIVVFGPKSEWFPTYQFFCKNFNTLCTQPPLEIITVELTENFLTHIKVSFWLGFIVAFPYILWEFWRFLKPGLYKHEIKAARGFVAICSFLFGTGVAFGYFIIAPFAITFLGSYQIGLGTENTVSLTSYVNNLTMYTIPTGLVFELPILVYFLTKIGLITPEFMKKYRKHALVLILIFAAIITPPDLITQLLIGLPVYILYEISILVSKRVVKKDASK